MKNHLSIVVFEIVAISLTGCYTQLAVPENDDTYVYHEPQPIIILYPPPCPQPVPRPRPIIPYPENPPKIEKIRKPVTAPRSNDGIRDDIKNSGGRNEGGRKSRR